MPDFVLTDPASGKKFKVTAPDGVSAVAAFKKMRAASTARPFDESAVPENQRSDILHPAQSEAYLGGAADMAGLGFTDEIAAAGLSGAGKLGLLPGGDQPSYDEVLHTARQRQHALQEEHPNSYLTGQIAGGALQAGGAAASGAVAPFAAAPSLAARMTGSALVGGGQGVAHGYGSGEGGVGNRAIQAGVEGATGLAAGGLFHAGGEAIGSAFRNVRDSRLFNQVAQLLGTTPQAVRQVLPQVEALGQQGAQNIGAAGQGAMLADAGPPLVGLLDTAIQKGGVGGVRAQQAIDNRVAQAGQNLNASMDVYFGGAPQGVTATQTAIRQGSQPARHAAYEAAYSQPIDYASQTGQEIEQLVRRRVPASAIERANALMRVEGQESQQILARIAPDGSVTFERMPDVRQLDYITRGLNDVARSGEGMGSLGGQTDIGRAFQGLSREIRNRLRQAVPEYGHALDTAADPIRRSEALQIGADALGKRTTRDAFAESIHGMSQAERQHVAQGIRSQIDETMANVKRTLQDPNVDARAAAQAIKDLSAPAVRQKVEMVIGQREAERLFARVDEVSHAFDMRAGVTTNSRTFGRQEAARTADMLHGEGGVVDAALSGHGINSMQRMIQALTGRTPEAKIARNAAHWGDVVDLLTMPAGRAGPMMNTLSGAARGSARTQQQAALIARLLGGPLGLGGPGGVLARDTAQKYSGMR